MKLKYYLTAIFFLLTFSFSCNEDEWLKEEPLDFYSPENSYITADQFDAALARLYGLTRHHFYETKTQSIHFYIYTSDLGYSSLSVAQETNDLGNTLVPENTSMVQFQWQEFYRIIFDANVVLSRIENEKVEIDSEAEKIRIKAEARFFRAFMYRNLVIMYGGVPLVLEEINGPKRDFVRATKAETIAQAITDAEFAAANLPHVTEVTQDGRLTKAAANHLLAELYIMAGDYDKSIAAASSVIDDPNYALMTDRFGNDMDLEGDVFWDLFRRNNQNRSGGNTEGIWVEQREYLLEGGGDVDFFPRLAGTQYWQLKGRDGKNLFFSHSAKYGGRTIGWYVPTDFLLNEVWDDPDNDIRTSKYNIIRDIVADNPQSAYYGQLIVENDAFDPSINQYNRNWTAIFAKISPINEFPPEVIVDPETGETANQANSTFRDHYYMRLSETYLLRAEAYLDKGDKAKAADDINVVRARANASPVAPGNVDIDYILDERARELCYETPRLLTLMRLGKWRERRLEYGPMYNGKYASNNFYDYQELFPIPQSEIERNTEAVLEPNPGYNN